MSQSCVQVCALLSGHNQKRPEDSEKIGLARGSWGPWLPAVPFPSPFCLPRLVRSGGKSQVIAVVLVIAALICMTRVAVTSGARSHIAGVVGRCLSIIACIDRLPVGVEVIANVTA